MHVAVYQPYVERVFLVPSCPMEWSARIPLPCTSLALFVPGVYIQIATPSSVLYVVSFLPASFGIPRSDACLPSVRLPPHRAGSMQSGIDNLLQNFAGNLFRLIFANTSASQDGFQRFIFHRPIVIEVSQKTRGSVCALH